MGFLKIYSEKSIGPFLKKRPGEIKFGERMAFAKSVEELSNMSQKYVLIGIPEDIGVRANLGKRGTAKAWDAALESFLNIQSNAYTHPENCVLLGEIDCDRQMQQAENLSINDAHALEELGELVIQIDHKVTEVIKMVIAAGKFPIIVGGGHNNSYGNLKGTSQALEKPVNCINFDAHSDFRSLEHRHSGNGFSYAFEDGFLGRYFIFGLHKNYTSQSIFTSIKEKSGRIGYSLLEDIAIAEKVSFSQALKEAEEFCCEKEFGIELDLDAIESMGSSAQTPSGFTMLEARKFVSHFSQHLNAQYLHLCEGSPEAGVYGNQVGKALAYLISDALAG